MPNDRPSYLSPSLRFEAPKYWMDFGRGETLAQFDRYRFFTPAPLYLYGRFDDRPLCDFLAQCKKNAHLMHHLFTRPLFANLSTPDGNADWNRALWAIEAEAWPEFEDFILAVTPFDRVQQIVYRAGAQDLDIVDPLYAEKHPVLGPEAPLARVVVFGVDSNKNQIAMAAPPNVDPRQRVPELGAWPPQARTIEFARLLFAGMNPAAAIDPAVTLPEQGVAPLRVKDISEFSDEKQNYYRQAIDEVLQRKEPAK